VVVDGEREGVLLLLLVVCLSFGLLFEALLLFPLSSSSFVLATLHTRVVGRLRGALLPSTLQAPGRSKGPLSLPRRLDERE
jgi:hypothetical protein